MKTNQPRRIQRKRTRGWRMPEGVVYVGRPSRWGNPFDSQMTISAAIQTYREMVLYGANGPRLMELAQKELRGKDLACWCPLDQPCHADVLLEIANR